MGIFVLIYYCVMPIYHSLQKKREREEAQTWENDPRWNGDSFRHMPKLPTNFQSDRTYSMRENPATETPMNIPVGAAKPPNYSDLFDHSGSSSLASSPPRYTSKTPSVEISSSNEEIVKTEGEAQA